MQDLYRRLLEFTRDGVCRYTFDDGRILMVNQGWIDIHDLDMKPEEAVGKHLRDLQIYTEKEGTVRRMLEKTGEIHAFEHSFKTLKGEKKWVLHDSFIVTDPTTGQKVVEAIIKDVTFIKKAQEELAESEERYRALFDQAAESIVLIDPETDALIEFNERAYKNLGFSRKEFSRLRIEDISTKPVEEIRRLNQEILRRGSLNFESKHRHKNGEIRDIRVSARAIPIRGKTLIQSIWQDVTEELRTGEIRRRAERLQAISTLAGGVAHNFANTLGVIRGRVLSILEALLPNTRAHADALRVLEATDRALNQTRRLLSIARVGESSREPRLQPVALAKIVKETCSLLEQQFAEKEIAIKFHGLEKAPPALCDPEQMQDVCMNLLLNALDFLPKGGLVSVSARYRRIARPSRRANPNAKPGHYVVLEVHDNGPGIPPQVLPRIFEPFFTTKESQFSFGLGLTVAQNMVQSWGGWISAHSTSGKGSAFCIWIPAGPVESKKASDKARKGVPPVCGTILIVEDSPATRQRIAAVLSARGHRILEASSAPDAIQCHRQHANEIGVSIVDLLIPEGGGRLVVEAILASDPESALVVLSGFCRDYVRSQIPLGAWTFVQKPFEDAQILDTVNDLLVERQRQGSAGS